MSIENLAQYFGAIEDSPEATHGIATTEQPASRDAIYLG